MFKFISSLILIVFVAVAQGNENLVATYSNDLYLNSSVAVENYLSINRQQYAQNIAANDQQMDSFNQTFGASLKTIKTKLNMLVESLVQTEKRLDPLASLSEKCVTKYRAVIPTVAATELVINGCVKTANDTIINMLYNPRSTRNTLDSYYKSTFENGISTCKNLYSSRPLNYTTCVIDTVSDANSYTITNQKKFAVQMDDAQCNFKANIKKALDCSFTAEYGTISAIAEANTLINKCLSDCRQCAQGYTCPEVFYVKRSEVSYTERTMANAFYGRYNAKNCLMMQIY